MLYSYTVAVVCAISYSFQGRLLSSFSLAYLLSILVPIECRSPPWTNVLIGMGVLALLAAILGVTVATVDVIIVCYIHLNKPKCCSNIATAVKKGELLFYHII